MNNSSSVAAVRTRVDRAGLRDFGLRKGCKGSLQPEVPFQLFRNQNREAVPAGADRLWLDGREGTALSMSLLPAVASGAQGFLGAG